MSHNQDGFTDNDPGNVLWHCGLCNKGYKTQSWFNKHMASKHSEARGGEAAAAAASDSTQRSGQDPHHTSPGAPLFHSTRVQGEKNFDQRSPLKIPTLSKKEWCFHNDQLEALLAASMKITNDNADNEIEIFDDKVYSYFKNVFGVQGGGGGSTRTSQENIFKRRLRKKKRLLRNQLKKAKEEGDGDLCHNLARAYRSLLKLIQGISQNMKENHERFLKCKNESQFDKDRFGYVKKVLEDVKGVMEFSKEQTEDYFKKTYSDKERSFMYDSTFLDYPGLIIQKETCPPTQEDVHNILKRSRNKSAPGPNGIPYVVYKNSPVLQMYLLRFYRSFWKTRSCPPAFGSAVIKLIPKKDVCEDPSQARPIALTNTHGKVFFSIVADRVNKHMTMNNLFNPSIQKGFVSGVSGCLEHTALMTEVLEDSRKHERQVYVSWLDLGNAFGSVKHNLLQLSMAHFQVPEELRRLIFSYYNTLLFIVSTQDWKTSVINFETGIFQGCCFSPVGFKLVFNLLLNHLKGFPKSAQYAFRKNQELVVPPCLAFADDLTLLSRTRKAMCDMLRKVEDFCGWSRCLKVKPEKCRALCLARRNTVFGPVDPRLTIDGEVIDEINSAIPFKFLGKYFHHCGKPDPNHAINVGFRADLKKIGGLPLSGPRKAWIYNNSLLSKLSWPLMVYELNKSTILRLEAEATASLKSWLGLRRSMDPSILYRSEKNFGFGLKKITTVRRQFAVSRSYALASSKDPLVRDVTDSSRLDLSSLQEKVSFDDRFMAGISSHREGLGFRKIREKTEVQKMRNVVQEEEESLAVVHAQGLAMQHDWLVLGESCIPPKLMWKAFLYEWSPELVKFYSNALQCTLPDPSNLKRWGLSASDSCGLCAKSPATALHVLAGCPVALEEGRYTWRHDRVLSIIREAVSLSIARARRTSGKKSSGIVFVKEGEVVQHQTGSSAKSSLFENSKDWYIFTDVGNRHYTFPPELAVTALCPDLTAMSESLKSAVIVELSVPWDTNIPKQHEYKDNKYSDLCSSIRLKGYKCCFHAVEVGARGVTSKSLLDFLVQLGLDRKNVNQFLKRISKTALESSYRIWLKRTEPWTQ